MKQSKIKTWKLLSTKINICWWFIRPELFLLCSFINRSYFDSILCWMKNLTCKLWMMVLFSVWYFEGSCGIFIFFLRDIFMELFTFFSMRVDWLFHSSLWFFLGGKIFSSLTLRQSFTKWKQCKSKFPTKLNWPNWIGWKFFSSVLWGFRQSFGTVEIDFMYLFSRFWSLLKKNSKRSVK